jgi:hypothetical protein
MIGEETFSVPRMWSRRQPEETNYIDAELVTNVCNVGQALAASSDLEL